MQYFINIFLFVFHRQGFFVEALTIADIAGHINSRQKMHFDGDFAVAFASFTSATLHIKRKSVRFPTTQPRLLGGSKKISDMRKSAGIGRQVRARSPTDG